MLKIDGSYGEGGGQILRSAIALSCITGKDIEITKIRANRPKPGLAAQHLKGVEAAKLISDAEVEGLTIGSTKVVFRPKRIRGGNYKIDIGTAGSVTLILQTILPPLLFAEKSSRLEIIGGTDVAWAPTIDYFRRVTAKAILELGAKFSIELKARGYYPKGGGKITVDIEPSKLRGKTFELSTCEILGVSHCQNLPEHVAIRQRDSALNFLKNHGLEAKIELEVLKGNSTGSGITIWCGYKGSSSLGEKGKRAEEVGIEAVKSFYEEFITHGTFDFHLADQIMIFSAVAKNLTKFSTTQITMHQKSNQYVINTFFDNAVKIDDVKREIEIRGCDL